MKKKLLMLVLGILVLNISVFSSEFAGKTFKAADDIGEWPPYVFNVRKNGEKTKEISGYSFDLVKKIAEKENFEVEVDLLPWKRAMKNVEIGRYQILMDSTITSERKKKYYYSLPIYTINNYYFYDINNFPQGLEIKSKKDLKKYKMGGLFGYSYEAYGVKSNEIDQGTKNYTQLIKKLKINRINIALAEYEILKGFEYVGKKYLDKDIRYEKVPGMEPTKFYFLFPKTEFGMKLRDVFNKNIDELQKSGELQKMLDKYLK